MPNTQSIRIKAAGIIWISAVQFFIAQIVAQWAWTTPFSLAANFISDLGNTTCGIYNGLYVCSPWHSLMNISFSLQGVIILTGAVLAFPVFKNESLKHLVFVPFVLTGLGMFGVGLFPENVNNQWHVISAGVQFVAGNFVLILIGVMSKPTDIPRPWFAGSIILGVAGLMATVLFVNGYGLGLGVGGMERVAAYTIPVWLMLAGYLLTTRLGRTGEI